jgi:hypothetical protein
MKAFFTKPAFWITFLAVGVAVLVWWMYNQDQKKKSSSLTTTVVDPTPTTPTGSEADPMSTASGQPVSTEKIPVVVSNPSTGVITSGTYAAPPSQVFAPIF